VQRLASGEKQLGIVELSVLHLALNELAYFWVQLGKVVTFR